MLEGANIGQSRYMPGDALEKHLLAAQQIQQNPERLTLRENIENRISFHKREIAALETALKNITEKPLSEVTLGDLNLAMRY